MLFMSVLQLASFFQIAATVKFTVEPNTLTYFYRDVDNKINKVANKKELSDHQSCILNLIYKNRNYSIGRINENYTERFSGLNTLIMSVYNSGKYQESKAAYPEHLTGHFNDHFSIYILNELANINRTGLHFPFTSFANLYIDLLVSLDSTNTDRIKNISVCLAKIEKVIDSIQTNLNASVNLSHRLDALRVICAKFDTLSIQFMSEVEDINSSAYLNAWNIKTYFATLGLVLNSLIQVHINEPSGVLYNNASKGIFELAKLVLFVTIRKSEIPSVMRAFDGVGVNAAYNLWASISNIPTQQQSDILFFEVDNKALYYNMFEEEAEANMLEIEALQEQPRVIMEDQTIAQNPVVQLTQEEKVIAAENTKNESEKQDNENDDKEMLAKTNKKTDVTDMIFNYLIPIALFITLVALSLVVFKFFIKRTVE